ncbi:MAG: hypothetical protein KJ047_03730 [Anaerolineae bacterium]|nr:hypothetical protein [Anaerolineae bacterium]MEB2288028.1 hypothetical protein [Anaerolineae bacterium]
MSGDRSQMAQGSDVPTLPEFPASLEPHELLEIVAGELRGPLGAVEGWARVIAGDPRLEAISLEAAESIPALTAYMRALLARVEQYLAARGSGQGVS